MPFRVIQLYLLEAMELEERQEEARLFRRAIRDAHDPFSLTENDFRANFRLGKEVGYYIVDILTMYLDVGTYSNRIPAHLRILSAIHFFAVGSYQRSVGNSLWACLSQPMVSRAIKDVSNAIIRHLMRHWIRLPRNHDERNINKYRFYLIYRMRHVIGVVDGTHVAIVRPKENEHAYVNRKGYHSLNVQIVCDAHLKILSIVSRWPGSSQDSYIWRNSRLAHTMRGNFENGDKDTKVLGDSSYPCLPWLLVPLPNPSTVSEINYNNRFKRTRSCVERCIGVLKGRFRCLLKDRTLHYSPRNASKIVMACAVLHNIAIHHNDEMPQPEYDNIDIDNVVAPPQHDPVYRQRGHMMRQQYIQRYF